jgi:hypothetical protein
MAERLNAERNACSFPIDDLKQRIYADILPQLTYAQIKDLKAELAAIPELNRTPMEYFETREERMKRGYQQFPKMMKFILEHNLLDE